MKLTLLGTGTPAPSLKRASSGYLIEFEDMRILLDHGPGAYHRLLQTGTNPSQITHLLFSHLHFDHCLDYPRLVLTRWDQGHGAIPELEVFGPPPTRQMTDSLFSPTGAYAADIQARINHPASIETYQLRGGKPPRIAPKPHVREVTVGDHFTLGAIDVQVIEVPHVQPWLTCLAYRLDGPSGSIVYSGDSGPCAELEELAKGCDVMIHMCHQLSGTDLHKDWLAGACGHLEVADAAQRAGAGGLVLTHLPDQIDVPGVRERVLGEIANRYDGHVYWGEDLLQVPLNGPAARRHTG